MHYNQITGPHYQLRHQSAENNSTCTALCRMYLVCRHVSLMSFVQGLNKTINRARRFSNYEYINLPKQLYNMYDS